MIGVIDLGIGNLLSLELALEKIGRCSRRVSTPEGIESAGCLVLPGVGSFGYASGILWSSGCGRAVLDAVAGGRKLLGICLGMQLMFEGSEESPGAPGLGLSSGCCSRLPEGRVKVPHTGWDTVEYCDGSTGQAYFVHSFCAREWRGEPAADSEGRCRYGESFLASFRAGPLAGCQFHPERSGEWGLSWLAEALRC